MIKLKNSEQIAKMRASGRLAAEALHAAGEMVKPGVSLLELDNKIRNYIEKRGGRPSFLNYGGFPKSSCISVNEVVIHGIPGNRLLEEGDIVSIDVGAYLNGYHGDCANTFPVGKVSPEALRLIETTKLCFYNGIAAIKEGARVGDISAAVQQTAESVGFSVVREYVGHGVGENLHEKPDVPNFGSPGRGPRLCAGMTFAVEPMVCAGKCDIRRLSDDWTVVTCDGSLAAHYEHTVAITSDGVLILTEL